MKRCTWLLPVLGLLLMASGSARSEHLSQGDSPREINPAPPVLAALAQHLVTASNEEKIAFARLALNELWTVYAAELTRAARAEPRTQAALSKLRRWRSATGAFLGELHRIHDTLESNATVRLYVDQRQRVLMFVDEHPIVVNGPRIGKKEALEQRIVEDYCGLHECGWLLDAPRQPNMPKRDYSLPGHWLLGQNHRPRYETTDGLTFEFTSLSDRASKAQACLGVIVELRELAMALRKAIASGHSIDWGAFRIESLPASEQQRIILDERGNYLKLALPNLEQAADLWNQARPWLRARADGATYRVSFLHAERLLKRR